MADIIIDKRVRVWAVQSIANLNGATVAELNAGIALSPFIPPDGFSGWKLSTAKVDNSGLESGFVTSRIGRAEAGDLTVTIKAQTGADTIWTTFLENYVTNIVVRRRGVLATTAWTAGQSYVLWPVEVGYRTDEDPAPNTLDRFTLPFAVIGDPILRGVVAA